MHGSSFQGQPGYHPQFYEPQSPPICYTTQQPLKHFPENFDPFDGEGDEDTDPVDMVSETQPTNEEAKEVEAEEVQEVCTWPKRAEKKHWSSEEEEETLAKSWIKISVDKEVGDRETNAGFWKRVLKHFKSLMPRTTCTKDQVNSKWGMMNPAIVAFNGYYHQAVRIHQIGCNDLQIFERAASDYEKHYNKPLTHVKAWHILGNQPKWLEQPVICQESEVSSKKRKLSKSSNVPTLRNEDDFECELPNLSDNPVPSRQSRGKKRRVLKLLIEARLHDTLATYKARKQSSLKAQLEVQRKKDEEYFKFVEGEVYNRDMKFVMEPHDNIPNLTFKEFTIVRKRELYAKYGWPCSL